METAAAFLGISVLVIVTPGQDTLTIRNTFLTSLLPKVVPSGPGAFIAMLGLGLVFCGMTLAWLALYALAMGRAGDILVRPKVRRVLDGVVGIFLVAFGLRLASQQR